MDDITKQLKPNSYKSKEAEAKSVEKVVTGKVVEKKKNNLIAEDMKDVKTYICSEVLLPALKKAISDVVTNGISMILYGDKGNPNRARNVPASTVSYNKYYSDAPVMRAYSRPAYSMFDTDAILFDSMTDASTVLTSLEDIISQYGAASVLDFYDLAGIANDNPQANKYGWTDVRSAEVMSRSGGYWIRLPRALPIT